MALQKLHKTIIAFVAVVFIIVTWMSRYELCATHTTGDGGRFTTVRMNRITGHCDVLVGSGWFRIDEPRN